MAFGRYGEQVRFQLFLPRGPHDPASRAEWIEQILHGLWEHGAVFHYGGFKQETTWEAVLATPTKAFSTLAQENDFSFEKEPLSVCITQMAATRSSTLEVYSMSVGGYLGFDFAIDAQASPEEAALLAHPLKRLGVNPSMDRLEFSVGETGSIGPGWLDHEESTYPSRRMYLIAYEEFWHWCTTLCELTEPIFGLGYSESQLTSVGLSEQYPFYLSGGQELLERRLPAMEGWFTRPPARYLAPDFPTDVVQQVIEESLQPTRQVPLGSVAEHIPPDALASFLSETEEGSFGASLRNELEKNAQGITIQAPGSIQRLRTGGVLARPGDPFFTVEAEYGFEALREALRLAERAQAQLQEAAPAVKRIAADEEVQAAAAKITLEQRERGEALARQARAWAQRAYRLFEHVGYVEGMRSAVDTLGAVDALQELPRNS